MEQTTRRKNPLCNQCVAAQADCLDKTRGPGCWQCYKRKIACSAAGAGRKWKETEEKKEKGTKGKGKEKEQRTERETEQTTEGSAWNAERVERLLAALEELVEEQRSMRMGMEVWMRKEEEKEKTRAEREDWRPEGEGSEMGMDEGSEEESETGTDEGSEEE